MSPTKDETHALDALAFIDRSSFSGNEQARLEALDKARALCQRLETPWDALRRQMWTDVSRKRLRTLSQT